jgi:hypothetical protein|tara:strand:- start:2543 stop:3064 length:522 start_codon:yes stop_codon:yes gene_type:complete
MLNSSSVKNNGCHLCFICLYIFAILILLAAALSYYIFGIIFLIQDYNVSNECKGSSLWEYVLVSLILSTSYLKYKNDGEENGVDKQVVLLVLLGIINLAISIWGGLELFYKSCDDLDESNLWIFGVASFGLQLLNVFICVIVFPIIVCCLIFKENDINNTNNNDVKLTINTNV